MAQMGTRRAGNPAGVAVVAQRAAAAAADVCDCDVLVHAVSGATCRG
jgi:hypothetical protein